MTQRRTAGKVLHTDADFARLDAEDRFLSECERRMGVPTDEVLYHLNAFRGPIKESAWGPALDAWLRRILGETP